MPRSGTRFTINSSSCGKNSRNFFLEPTPKISVQFIDPNANAVQLYEPQKAIESIKSISLKLADLAD